MSIQQIINASSLAQQAVTAWGNAQYALLAAEANGDGVISGSDAGVSDAWSKYNDAVSKINALQPLCDAEHGLYNNFDAGVCSSNIASALSTLTQSVLIPTPQGQIAFQPADAGTWANIAWFRSTNTNAPVSQISIYAFNMIPFTEAPPSVSISFQVADFNANTLQGSYNVVNPPQSGGIELYVSRAGAGFSMKDWNWLTSQTGAIGFTASDDIIDTRDGTAVQYQAYFVVNNSAGQEAARSGTSSLTVYTA